MIILLVIIGVALLVFNFWNLRTLKSIKKNAIQKDSQLNDAKYFELKSKSEFIIAIFSVIVAVAGLLGYNTLQGAKNEIKSELINKTKSIDSLLTITEDRVQEKDSILAQLELKLDIISSLIPLNEKQLNSQRSQLNSLQKVIRDLNTNNKIKQSFYIVRNLEIKKSKKPLVKYFKFNNIKTNIGDNLPKFSKQPIVIPIPESTADFQVYNITSEGFYVGIASSTEWEEDQEPETYKFSLMIFESK